MNWSEEELRKKLKENEELSSDMNLVEDSPPIFFTKEPGKVRLLKTMDVLLPPYGKPRPRVTKGGAHTYMPPNYIVWRDGLRSLYGMIDSPLPLHMEVIAYRKALAKWGKKKREEMLGLPCTSKPDLDNLVGSIMDAVLEEDSRVASIVSRKLWSMEGSMTISFYEIV